MLKLNKKPRTEPVAEAGFKEDNVLEGIENILMYFYGKM